MRENRVRIICTNSDLKLFSSHIHHTTSLLTTKLIRIVFVFVSLSYRSKWKKNVYLRMYNFIYCFSNYAWCLCLPIRLYEVFEIIVCISNTFFSILFLFCFSKKLISSLIDLHEYFIYLCINSQCTKLLFYSIWKTTQAACACIDTMIAFRTYNFLLILV